MRICDIEYYGVKVEFPEDFVRFWKWGFPEYRVHLHHCTLGHRTNMQVQGLLQAFLSRGEECKLVLDAVGKYTLPDDRGEVIAFRVKNNRVDVEDYQMIGQNKTFHITAFTRGAATAKDSNLITDWELMGEINLKGCIKFWNREGKEIEM